MELSNNKKIFLIGMMGSGKSSVGIKLSGLLNFSLYDIDKIIGVPKYFNNNTLNDFRNRELEEISSITSLNQKCIISSGGGSILTEKTRDIMDKHYCVYLKTSIHILMDRIAQHKIKRPIIHYDTNGEINKKHFNTLYKTRVNHYKKLSSLTVLTDHLNIIEIANQIKNTIVKDAAKN